mmetsp:Transcript_21244/g.56781  ORF Transcript_21244/g.56781 Transcript_21244/m.56781 type:complete len:503 (-) Transcript_21244:158-1666(-)
MAVAFSATATPLPPGLHGPPKLWVEMPRLHLSAAASVITAAAVVARPVRARRRANPRNTKLLVSLAAVAPSEADVAFLSSVLHEMDQLVMLQKSGEAAEKLARSMVRVTAEPGEVIVRQGQTGESMFIIGEGEVLFETTSASGEPQYRTVSRGIHFGAVTLLGNTTLRVTAVAKTHCILWRVNRATFDQVVLSRTDTHSGDIEHVSEEAEVLCDTTTEIFVVSDGTGESASMSLNHALRQFHHCFRATGGRSRTTIYRFVRSADEAKQIIAEATKRKALVVYTVTDRTVHAALEKECLDAGVQSVDLWASLFTTLESVLGAERSGVIDQRQAVSVEYMHIVEAIEYTRKVDDGVLPKLWAEADIMLVGPSRSGKTPLAFYLAQRGLKVANYPLVPDEEPPKELFEIDQEKCFALIIAPEKLQKIRMERMAQFGRQSSSYASIANVRKEVAWMKQFFISQGPAWPVIDTTNAGLVEVAAHIFEILDRRKGDSLAACFKAPTCT